MVTDKFCVKKYTTSSCDFAFINALRRPNQIQNKTVKYKDETGKEIETNTIFIADGDTDLKNPIILFPIIEDQSLRERLKIAVSKLFPNEVE